MKRFDNLSRICIPLLCACLIATVFSIGVIPSQPAQAKQGPISIRSVYTTDENQNNKTDFAPGDNINYHVDFDNNTGSETSVDVKLEVIANSVNNTSDYPNAYSYTNSFRSDNRPTGLTRLYTPATVSAGAAGGDYSIRISVTPSNSGSPANDGDWGEGNFKIQQSTPA